MYPLKHECLQNTIFCYRREVCTSPDESKRTKRCSFTKRRSEAVSKQSAYGVNVIAKETIVKTVIARKFELYTAILSILQAEEVNYTDAASLVFTSKNLNGLSLNEKFSVDYLRICHRIHHEPGYNGDSYNESEGMYLHWLVQSAFNDLSAHLRDINVRLLVRSFIKLLDRDGVSEETFVKFNKERKLGDFTVVTVIVSDFAKLESLLMDSGEPFTVAK